MTLYIVGTPIGNLSDISARVLDTLNSVALIAAEDTRVTTKLLSKYDIHTKLTSSHAHNEKGKARELIARMLETGDDIALVTDAGMPTVSDPGAAVVSAARRAGVNVVCVPGPSAALAVLALTGWEYSAFAFYGFLPRNAGELRQKLYEMSRSISVAVVYESPHRVETLLTTLAAICPEARVCLANDITKLYEWSCEGTVSDVLAAHLARENAQKGEYALAIQFPPMMVQAEEPISAETWILDALFRGMNMRQAMEFARTKGAARNDVYQGSLAVKEFIKNAWNNDY